MSALAGDVVMDNGRAHVIGIADEALSHERYPFQVDGRAEGDADGVRQEGLTEKQRQFAIWLGSISVFDVFLSGLVAVIAFAHAYRDTGVSLYCLGVQAMSHALSSTLLGLRFFGEYRLPSETPAGMKGLLRTRRRRYLVREQILNTIMGVVMLLSSAALLFKAVRKIKYWNTWYLDHVGLDQDCVDASIFLAWYGCCLYFCHSVVRGYCGYVLQRSVVWNGFIASLVSVLFLLVIGIAVTFEEERAWKAEPIAAIILSAVTIIQGARLIHSHRFDIEERLQNDARA